MAVIRLLFRDGLAGSAWCDRALCGGSPARAPERELRGQDPVGLWGPAGLTVDVSRENFQRRRLTEPKRGREYITPVTTGKLSGYQSLSAGLEFADIWYGLGAISKQPAAGWTWFMAYDASCALSQDQSPGAAAAAGDFGIRELTSACPAE